MTSLLATTTKLLSAIPQASSSSSLTLLLSNSLSRSNALLTRTLSHRHSPTPTSTSTPTPTPSSTPSSSSSSNLPLPLPPKLPTLASPADTAQARSWLSLFKTHAAVPRELVELSFARSSGPGGQNVNKVNTKASVRCSLEAGWIPLWAHEALKKSPHYVASSHSLLVTSTATRSQSQNLADCLAKLHGIVLAGASSAVVTEPSEEQKEKVRRLASVEKARRRQEKDRRSAVKRGRSSARGGWD